MGKLFGFDVVYISTFYLHWVLIEIESESQAE